MSRPPGLILLASCKRVCRSAAAANSSTLFSAEDRRLLSSNATRASEETEYDNFPHAQTMANFPPATHDLFDFDQLLTEQEKDVKYRTRSYMVISLFHDRHHFEIFKITGIKVPCKSKSRTAAAIV